MLKFVVHCCQLQYYSTTIGVPCYVCIRIEPASRTKNRTRTRTEPLIGRTRTEPELFKQQDNKNQNRTEPCPYKNPNRTRTIDLRFFPISSFYFHSPSHIPNGWSDFDG
jgi:hypothetical protein